jgi:hypothetical protein
MKSASDKQIEALLNSPNFADSCRFDCEDIQDSDWIHGTDNFPQRSFQRWEVEGTCFAKLHSVKLDRFATNHWKCGTN